jgi:hypothetical protein
MAVRCEGDSRVMEQLGEKQDFESELSRLGFSHEAFTLYVRRANAFGGTNWNANYAVCVTSTTTKRQNIYWGGPGDHWVSEFAADVARGVYGSPDLRPPVAHASSNAPRPRLVARGAKPL